MVICTLPQIYGNCLQPILAFPLFVLPAALSHSLSLVSLKYAGLSFSILSGRKGGLSYKRPARLTAATRVEVMGGRGGGREGGLLSYTLTHNNLKQQLHSWFHLSPHPFWPHPTWPLPLLALFLLFVVFFPLFTESLESSYLRMSSIFFLLKICFSLSLSFALSFISLASCFSPPFFSFFQHCLGSLCG